MSKETAIDAALAAGRKAAELEVGSTFDITNDAYRGAYVRRIREAMAAKLTEHESLAPYTDTNFDMFEDIARDEGFSIGIFDRNSRRVIVETFICFDSVDFVIGTGKVAV